MSFALGVRSRAIRVLSVFGDAFFGIRAVFERLGSAENEGVSGVFFPLVCFAVVRRGLGSVGEGSFFCVERSLRIEGEAVLRRLGASSLAGVRDRG